MENYFRIQKNLDDFPLDIEVAFDKGILIIEGESGAGKTTILNCIAGLTSPDEGEIKIQGETVFKKTLEKGNIDIPSRNRNIGYLFQNYALFPNLTVEENIIYGIKNLAEYKDKAKRKNCLQYSQELMVSFGIAHLGKKLPENISGGEKQRVAFLRAIVTKPKLLLMDEPFSALDKKTKEKVYEEFRLFKKEFQIPMILITHDAKESEMFGDHILLIEEGKMI
ncbi:MAG: ATP-binding cassette domain-containing protein [Eubacteriaceae bacterium]